MPTRSWARTSPRRSRPTGARISSHAPVEASRALVLDLFDAAVAAAAPGPMTARAVGSLKLAREPRVWVYAFGKAARPMAQAGVTALLGARHTIAGGVVVAADDGPPPYPTLVSRRGDHPTPGRHSFGAAAAIGDATAGRRGADIAIVLISGGTS